MFRSRIWSLTEFAYRSQRARTYALDGGGGGSPALGPFIYNGGTATSSTYTEALNGKNASFTTWQRTIIPSDAGGNYAEA
jgi:hypothetical protein